MNEDKRSIYRIIREDELKYTRQDASDVLDGITEVRDPLEIYVDEETILLKKYSPLCIHCGESDDLVECREQEGLPEVY